MYPGFVGFVDLFKVSLSPFNTNWESTIDPPSESNEIQYPSLMIAYTLTDVLSVGTVILSAIFVVPFFLSAQPTILCVASTS